MTRKLSVFFGWVFLVGFAAAAFALEPQQTPAILKVVENYVRSETAGLPGQVTISLGGVDPRVILPACPALEPFLPAGGRLWGQSTVGVRCNSQTAWTLYVPVTVKVIANVVHTVRPLAQGRAIGVADIILQKADLSQLPAGILTDLSQVIGKTLITSLASGQPLRQDLLRSPTVILQGQTVKLQARGEGFSVSSEGKALAAATEGQVVQVRIQSGHIISGIARHEAIVEVRP